MTEGFDVDEQRFQVRKYVTYQRISDEEAMEFGLIPDTRPPLPPPSWRQRARWRIAAAVRPVRLRLAARVGGVSVEALEEATWL
ncbi:hypothetical protein [Nonomuraea sp. SBT364]|uniref:hypothetical protein n=1 Tax=Nonomuraea sp. SBT364 TaxID=1580530 RepID=UPI00066A26D4|nr:hypothetical protein [Nonomuraea sp. SBT364]